METPNDINNRLRLLAQSELQLDCCLVHLHDSLERISVGLTTTLEVLSISIANPNFKTSSFAARAGSPFDKSVNIRLDEV